MKIRAEDWTGRFCACFRDWFALGLVAVILLAAGCAENDGDGGSTTGLSPVVPEENPQDPSPSNDAIEFQPSVDGGSGSDSGQEENSTPSQTNEDESAEKKPVGRRSDIAFGDVPSGVRLQMRRSQPTPVLCASQRLFFCPCCPHCIRGLAAST